MKNLIITLLVALVFAFAGCKQQEKSSNVEETKSDSSQVAQDSISAEE